tara:strand:+ start:3083 stop:3289 length:207 start_codon:yes stop_codon:yes gene_type:complete
MSSLATMSAVANSFKFASEKVSQNLLEHVKRENINLEEQDLRKLMTVIESSISQAFSLSSASIEKTLK